MNNRSVDKTIFMRYAAIGTTVVVCFALTLSTFFPGIMTYDARYVYDDIAKGMYGDWQSPLMTALWACIDPIAPGSGSMFLFMATLYWLAIGAMALALASRSLLASVILLTLSLSPPAFLFVGTIWRDMLFGYFWLAASVLAYLSTLCRPTLALVARIVALAMVLFGVLLRPNAIFAAPLLVVYVLYPLAYRWRLAVGGYIPIVLSLVLLVHFTYHVVMGAERQHPEQTIMVFDLGGIGHFAGENQFPVAWSSDVTQLLIGPCYNPVAWDLWFAPGQRCNFLMHRLESDKLFGSNAIVTAWLKSIRAYPLAYARHRVAFMREFLTGSNLVMWTLNIADVSKPLFPDRDHYQAIVSLQEKLKATPIFRIGLWLTFNIAILAVAWRRRGSGLGALSFAVCGSATVYILSFLFLGVASDFRYAYWSVLAAIVGLAACIAGTDQRRELTATTGL